MRGWRVVALLWWWGVVFDLWIVVASIDSQEEAASLVDVVLVVFLCGVISDFLIFLFCVVSV